MVTRATRRLGLLTCPCGRPEGHRGERAEEKETTARAGAIDRRKAKREAGKRARTLPLSRGSSVFRFCCRSFPPAAPRPVASILFRFTSRARARARVRESRLAKRGDALQSGGPVNNRETVPRRRVSFPLRVDATPEKARRPVTLRITQVAPVRDLAKRFHGTITKARDFNLRIAINSLASRAYATQQRARSTSGGLSRAPSREDLEDARKRESAMTRANATRGARRVPSRGEIAIPRVARMRARYIRPLRRHCAVLFREIIFAARTVPPLNDKRPRLRPEPPSREPPISCARAPCVF